MTETRFELRRQLPPSLAIEDPNVDAEIDRVFAETEARLKAKKVTPSEVPDVLGNPRDGAWFGDPEARRAVFDWEKKHGIAWKRKGARFVGNVDSEKVEVLDIHPNQVTVTSDSVLLSGGVVFVTPRAECRHWSHQRTGKGFPKGPGRFRGRRPDSRI